MQIFLIWLVTPSQPLVAREKKQNGLASGCCRSAGEVSCKEVCSARSSCGCSVREQTTVDTHSMEDAKTVKSVLKIKAAPCEICVCVAKLIMT